MHPEIFLSLNEADRRLRAMYKDLKATVEKILTDLDDPTLPAIERVKRAEALGRTGKQLRKVLRAIEYIDSGLYNRCRGCGAVIHRFLSNELLEKQRLCDECRMKRKK